MQNILSFNASIHGICRVLITLLAMYTISSMSWLQRRHSVCVHREREWWQPEGKIYVTVNVFIEWLAIHHRTEYFRCFASSSFGYLCFKEKERESWCWGCFHRPLTKRIKHCSLALLATLFFSTSLFIIACYISHDVTIPFHGMLHLTYDTHALLDIERQSTSTPNHNLGIAVYVVFLVFGLNQRKKPNVPI